MRQLLTLALVLFSFAGFSQTVTNTVTLSGSGTDADGTVSGYQWTKVSGPTGDVITGASTATPKVVYNAPGVYVYSLVVTDNQGAKSTNSAITTVTVLAANIPPVAKAGADIVIQLPSSN